MNRNVKIAIGIAVGLGLVYLGYRYFFKSSDAEKGKTTSDNLVYDKASREVVLVENA